MTFYVPKMKKNEDLIVDIKSTSGPKLEYMIEFLN